MLIYNFTRIMEIRCIVRPFSYFSKRGLCNSFATRITRNRVKNLKLSELEKICTIIKCTPNDLFEWIPNKGETDIQNHPLISLKRNKEVLEITEMLRSVPLDKLSNIHQLINEEINK